MTEDFLHFVWKYQRFRSPQLVTADGAAVTVTVPGQHNHDGGPDFLNARVRIGLETWAGHVELHIHASDWMKHRHQNDRAYDNVILHVVFENDVPVRRSNGELLPTLELRGHVEPLLYQKYRSLQTTKTWVPCQEHLHDVTPLTLGSWLDRMATERLEEKTGQITDALKSNNNSWEEVFYQRMARHFGMRVNDEPFELLAKSVPVSLLAKYRNNLDQVEALLFGQAGMLGAVWSDDYPRRLQTEYDHLRRLHQLTPMPSHVWQFMRMRPANFPTVRIAQLAMLVHRATHLFSRTLESATPGRLRALFSTETSPYWLDHYHFDRLSAKRSKAIGSTAIDNLMINVVAPMLFVYADYHSQPGLKERALRLLQAMPAEQNSMIRKWRELGVRAENAFDSQALIRLKKIYCNSKRCLDCGIGNAILKPQGLAAS